LKLKIRVKKTMNVKIINTSSNELPMYETSASAGLDLRAAISETIVMQPLERKLIKTGLFLEIPEGYEAQVRPRSGLALKQGITVLNSPGTIDADYRGEIGVILINLGSESVEIQTGDRIAQLVFARVEQAEWQLSDSLSETERGTGGFGSTGKK
jgi:dUTP pyrophosphatase